MDLGRGERREGRERRGGEGAERLQGQHDMTHEAYTRDAALGIAIWRELQVGSELFLRMDPRRVLGASQ